MAYFRIKSIAYNYTIKNIYKFIIYSVSNDNHNVWYGMVTIYLTYK